MEQEAHDLLEVDDLEIELTVADVKAWAKYWRKTLGPMRHFLTPGWAALGVVIAAADDGWIRAGILVFIGCFYVWIAWSVRVNRRTYSQIAIEGTGLLHVDEEALTLSNPKSSTRRLWGWHDEVVETDDHVFLVAGGCAARIIPKRSFPSPQAASAFVAVARARLTT